MVDALSGSEQERLANGYFMSNDADARGFTPRTRSSIFFGGPLPGFRNEDDRKDDQDKLLQDGVIEAVEKRLFDLFGHEPSFFRSAYANPYNLGDMRVRFISAQLFGLEFPRVVNGDLAWTMGSILFVCIYLRVHTGSCFLAAVGMFQIIFSLPASYFIYRYMFGIAFFTQVRRGAGGAALRRGAGCHRMRASSSRRFTPLSPAR